MIAVIAREGGRSRCYGGGAAARVWTCSGAVITPGRPPMSQSFDASRSLTAFEQDSTLVAVIEMSQSKWLVAAVIPGVARQPLKKLDADAGALLKLLQRWRDEARKAGHEVKRVACAYEAGRDGFWLARWLQAHTIEAYVIHATSIAV